MPNRDYDDSYNRSEGRPGNRDEHDQRDQGYRGASGWERQNDDHEGAGGRERGYGSEYQSLREQHQQRATHYGSSGYGRDRGYGERGAQERDGQRLGQQEWSRAVGPYRAGSVNYGPQDYRRPEPGRARDWNDYAPQGNYAPEWRSYAQDWSDQSPARRGAAQQQGWGSDDRAENPFNAQERTRQEWNRTVGTGHYARDGYGPSFGGPSAYGRRDDESWGEQIRHAGQQVVSRVKRAFRGPKGYKRSDERIREDVNDRLAQQFDFDPSEVEVSVAGGEVTLTGFVRSRHEKFIAEEISDEVSGVSEVHNQIRVKRDDPLSSTASSSAGSASSTTLVEGTKNRNAPRA